MFFWVLAAVGQVLRANKEVLLTIMEVFIYDPLYKWALTTSRALQRQLDDPDQVRATEGRSMLTSHFVHLFILAGMGPC